jgi:hypothetical protein
MTSLLGEFGHVVRQRVALLGHLPFPPYTKASKEVKEAFTHGVEPRLVESDIWKAAVLATTDGVLLSLSLLSSLFSLSLSPSFPLSLSLSPLSSLLSPFSSLLSPLSLSLSSSLSPLLSLSAIDTIF